LFVGGLEGSDGGFVSEWVGFEDARGKKIVDYFYIELRIMRRVKDQLNDGYDERDGYKESSLDSRFGRVCAGLATSHVKHVIQL
jgi:hypothetical protein